MSFLKFGIIAIAHVVALGIVYLLSTIGGEESGTATAGANGLVTWSSQEPNADRQIVGSTSGLPFDERSGNLAGYNAGDPRPAPAMVAQNNSSGRIRMEPTRPSGSSSSSSRQSDDLLAPLEPVEPPRSYSAPTRSLPATPLPPYTEYTVVRGDSLWGISKKYNVTIADIQAENPGMSASNLRVGTVLRIPRSSATPVSTTGAQQETAAPKVQGMKYTVRPGDSLSKIAANQGTTVSALKAANGLRSDVIRVGQELVVPNAVQQPELAGKQWTGAKVVIKPGDTLGKIAALYDADVIELMKLNDISNPRLIRIGQTILIPESKSSSPSPSRSQPARSNPAPAKPAERPAPAIDPVPRQPDPVLPISEPVLSIEEEPELPIEEPLIEIEE